MDTFSINTPLKVKEVKWILGVSVSKTYNFVFNICKQNSSLSLFTPRRWEDPETNEKPRRVIEHRK